LLGFGIKETCLEKRESPTHFFTTFGDFSRRIGLVSSLCFLIGTNFPCLLGVLVAAESLKPSVGLGNSALVLDDLQLAQEEPTAGTQLLHSLLDYVLFITASRF